MDKPRDGAKMACSIVWSWPSSFTACAKPVHRLLNRQRFFPCSLSAVIVWRISVVCSEFRFINTFQESWVSNKIPFSQKAKLLTGFKTRAGFFHLAKHSESFVSYGWETRAKTQLSRLIFLIELQGLCKKHEGLHHRGLFGALAYDKCHYLPEQLMIWQNWASLVMSLLI